MSATPREQALGKLQEERRNQFAAVDRVERATQTSLHSQQEDKEAVDPLFLVASHDGLLPTIQRKLAEVVSLTQPPIELPTQPLLNPIAEGLLSMVKVADDRSWVPFLLRKQTKARIVKITQASDNQSWAPFLL
jgi:hypothetical protein